MPTQKIFKQRVRARMTKTGESYTAARLQLLRKAGTGRSAASEAPPVTGEALSSDLLTSDDAMRRGSGRGHEEWFGLLDAWGATERRHTAIATWLRETHAVPGWWAQNITVAYERARGMRSRHQVADGFTIGVTRTVAADPARTLAAFTDPDLRRRWLPDVTLRQRPTRARHTARFDWADPPSRLVVVATPRGTDRTTVSIAHEKLADGESAERLKIAWREWLGLLKQVLEQA